MCRTVHALLSTVICGIQMMVRVFMTIILMIENLVRMVLQTLYNFISFMLQMVSLIPICVVFLVTARLKCFMCGGGGPCPVNRGGACDCLMSAVALIILFFIFRATGVLDKIFYKIGYVQAPPIALVRFVPTPGDVTECSRNDSHTNPATTPPNLLRYMDYTTETETEEESDSTTKLTTVLKTLAVSPMARYVKSIVKKTKKSPKRHLMRDDSTIIPNPNGRMTYRELREASTEKMNVTSPLIETFETDHSNSNTFPTNLTTVLYFLV